MVPFFVVKSSLYDYRISYAISITFTTSPERLFIGEKLERIVITSPLRLIRL